MPARVPHGGRPTLSCYCLPGAPLTGRRFLARSVQAHCRAGPMWRSCVEIAVETAVVSAVRSVVIRTADCRARILCLPVCRHMHAVTVFTIDYCFETNSVSGAEMFWRQAALSKNSPCFDFPGKDSFTLTVWRLFTFSLDNGHAPRIGRIRTGGNGELCILQWGLCNA